MNQASVLAEERALVLLWPEEKHGQAAFPVLQETKGAEFYQELLN